MTGLGATLALAVLCGWTVFALCGLLVAPAMAAGLALVAGAAAVVLRDTLVLEGAVALLAPFGVMLPALALRHMAVQAGLTIPGFAVWELVVFLVAYTAFLATAFGVIPLELYRLGYAPGPVTAMVLVVCGYALVTGNWFLALVAVVGQLFWAAGWGSSNWFDHVLHVLLVPVALVAVVLRSL